MGQHSGLVVSTRSACLADYITWMGLNLFPWWHVFVMGIAAFLRVLQDFWGLLRELFFVIRILLIPSLLEGKHLWKTSKPQLINLIGWSYRLFLTLLFLFQAPRLSCATDNMLNSVMPPEFMCLWVKPFKRNQGCKFVVKIKPSWW